jgi:hypothetical protein
MLSYQSSIDLYWFSLTLSLAFKELPPDTGSGIAMAETVRATARTRNFILIWLKDGRMREEGGE